MPKYKVTYEEKQTHYCVVEADSPGDVAEMFNTDWYLGPAELPEHEIISVEEYKSDA